MHAAELAIANDCRAIVYRAVNTLADAGFNTEADELENDLRHCFGAADFLMVRDDAELWLGRLAANQA